MVYGLARVIEAVAQGRYGSASFESEQELEYLKTYFRDRANLRRTRTRGGQLDLDDIFDAEGFFDVMEDDPNYSPEEDEPASSGIGEEDEAHQKSEDVHGSVAEAKQHNHADDLKPGCGKGNGGQANTSWKATVLPGPISSSPRHSSLRVKFVKRANESQSGEAITQHDASSSPFLSPNQRARSEEISLSHQAITTSQGPAKRRRLDTSEVRIASMHILGPQC